MSEAPADFELRASSARVVVDTADDRLIRGNAIVFNTPSQVLSHRSIGQFRERIRASAVDRTLRGGNAIKALWNHNEDLVLGNTRSGTLVLTKTKKGLAFEIDPPKWANSYLETIERGDVDGMSFKFRAIQDEWDLRTADGIPMREVIDMEFPEISIVTFQAYLGTDVSMSKRSLEAFAEEQAVQFGKRTPPWRAQWHEIERIARG